MYRIMSIHCDGNIRYFTTWIFSIKTSNAYVNTLSVSDVLQIWTTDTTAPTITSVPTSGLALGCNPAVASQPTYASDQAELKAIKDCAWPPTIAKNNSDGTLGCVTTRTYKITSSYSYGHTSQSIT